MIPRRSLRNSLFVAVATLLALRASPSRAQAPVAADGSAVPLTRFEMQRALLEIDEQRRRLEMGLEPVDSVLRVLAADTLHILGLKRSPAIDQEMGAVTAASNQLAQFPGAPDATRHLIDAATAVSRDFTIPENTLGARVMLAQSAQEYLSRTPNAAVVSVNDELPPFDTPLWDKIRQSDYGRDRMPRVTPADVAGFQAAVSDSGFVTYQRTLVSAYAHRLADIRQSRDSTRADIGRLRRRAADLARTIGEQDTNVQVINERVVDIGLPVFGAVLILVLFMPRMYRSEDLQRWMFSSGLIIELATVTLITATTLLLALANRIPAEVVGTLLGGLSGYMLGRSIHRRPEPLVMPQVQPVQHTPVASRFR